MTTYFTDKSLKFLRALARHNERAWFHAHKADYEAHVRGPFQPCWSTCNRTCTRSASTSAPNRRPSADRCSGSSATPASPTTRRRTSPGRARACSTSAARQLPAPSFYLHLQPGSCFVGAGLWHPETPTQRQGPPVHLRQSRQLETGGACARVPPPLRPRDRRHAGASAARLRARFRVHRRPAPQELRRHRARSRTA